MTELLSWSLWRSQETQNSGMLVFVSFSPSDAPSAEDVPELLPFKLVPSRWGRTGEVGKHPVRFQSAADDLHQL